jgi:hypothetical protein
MDDFWQNISRYPRCFVTIILGIFFALFERVKPLLTNPVTVIALVGFLIGGFIFFYFTLKAMLGLG